MLESNRDDVKLEAMRCVTVMTAKGKLSVPRSLFPHIVKNISTKNPELKKLIYLYLSHYADQEQDMALLPVATLQKSLKSPNPLMRSSALKVLTSMRLSILSAILMATLRNSVNDLSPYVRKTVAHSIMKIHRIEPDARADLIEYIERLFNDKNSMVLSSAVATFEVVCPERLDLVHKNYRRFCFILADCNEWGQTLLIKLLMRYLLNAYEQLKSGKLTDYNPSEHDPKILLRSAKPLVHSNNAAVVMAVVKLFIAIANHNEVRSTITRPLIRLLHTHREIELVVLNMIDELTQSSVAIKDDKHWKENPEVEGEVNNNGKEEDVVKEDVLVVEMPEVVEETSQEIKADENQNGEIEIDKGEYEELTNGDEAAHDIPKALDLDSSTVENDTATGSGSESNKIKASHDEDEAEVGEESEETEESEEEDSDDDDEESSEDDDDSDSEDDEDSEVVQDQSDKEDHDEKREIDFSATNFESNQDPCDYREVFRLHIKSFFVKHTDCTQIRLVKLRILTNLCSSVNVSQVLRELQAYIAAYVDDKEFVSGAIHAMGRCAIIVKEVAHICLNGLTSLLSNNNEHIVSEAIVVLRSQIINKGTANDSADKNDGTKELQSDENKSEKSSESGRSNNELSLKDTHNQNDKIVSTVIKQVTKLLPTVTAHQARATILWILAEFCSKNRTAAKCAPNVLRLIAKSFCQEDNFVKLQSLTLASKLLLSLDKNSKADLYHKVHLLAGYLFSLAKYDINHDVRDRGRFLKKLLEDERVCCRTLNGTVEIFSNNRQ